MKNKSTFDLPLPPYYNDKNDSMGGVIEEDPGPPPTWQRRMKKVVKKRLPIFSWLPKYKKGDLVADLIAGVTVGLTVVPQSMAYAAIAGLSPEYGLYSSYFTCLVYVILGSCRQAAIGPTAVMGLLTFQTCGNNNPSCAILTAFYSGVFELAMAILSLGWVVSFISEPVTIGFTAGASVTIMSSQVKSLFGISGPKGDGFVGYWEAIIRDISQIHLGDSILGVTCVIALLLLRKLKDLPINKPSPALKYALWLISTAKNVIIVILTTIMAWLWQDPPFKIVGHVQGGFPPITVPEFRLPNMETYNATMDGDDIERLSFSETWQYLKAGPFIIAVIAVLQNVAISKAFGSGQSVDATQEMYALGICNVFGSFIKAIPTSGSFSRSAVNEASGVRSPLGSMFTGLLVIFSLGLLTPSFYYIPKASLAAVIMTAVYFMIEFEALKPMWRISKVDFVVCIITFAVALYLGMEYGILVGVGLSIGNILLKSLKPVVHRELRQENGVKYFVITPEAGLFFPSVDFVRTYLNKLALKQKKINIYVLNFAKWKQYDYTAANALASLVKGFNKNKKTLQFTNCSEEWSTILQDAGLAKPPIINWHDIPEFVTKSSTALVIQPPSDIIVESDPNGSQATELTHVSSNTNGNGHIARAS